MSRGPLPDWSGLCLPFAVLRHELPDGSFHFDWLFGLEKPARTKLVTFCSKVNPEEMTECDIIDLERIADHRIRYLTYEGVVSGGRGEVRRCGSGVYEIDRQDWNNAGGWDGKAFDVVIRVRMQFDEHGDGLVQDWVLDGGARTGSLLLISGG